MWRRGPGKVALGRQEKRTSGETSDGERSREVPRLCKTRRTEAAPKMNIKKEDAEKDSTKKKGTGQGKRRVQHLPMEIKKEIIAKYEQGARVTCLSEEYGLSKSTISTFVKHKEKIKAANVAKGVKAVTKQRGPFIEEVEKRLLIWINEKQLAGDAVSEAVICEKARLIYGDLVNNTPGSSAEGERASDFKASRGWFEKFRKRAGIHSVARRGEAASAENNLFHGADQQAAEMYVQELEEYVEAEGFIPQQVFNCEETGLFWKVMPKHTYATKEEAKLDISSSEIKEVLASWDKVQSFVERCHPNKETSVRVINLFNENAMAHFREVLKRRQKQTSLDKFIVSYLPGDPEARPSTSGTGSESPAEIKIKIESEYA